MKILIRKVFPYLFIVGLLGWAFGLAYAGISVVEPRSITYGSYTWHYYAFNFQNWIQSLEHSITDSSILTIEPNRPVLARSPNWIDVLAVLKWAFNTLFIYLFNWVIYALNWVVFAPLKVVLYPVNIIYAIFGLNTASADWIKAMSFLYTFQIPQIPYI